MFFYKGKDPQHLTGFQSRQPEALLQFYWALLPLARILLHKKYCTSCLTPQFVINKKINGYENFTVLYFFL